MDSNRKCALEQPSQKAGARTGVVYDEAMLEHKCLWEAHQESPERLSAVIERCEQLDLLSRCVSLTPRLATEDEISSAHSPDLFQKLKAFDREGAEMSHGELEEFSAKYESVYFHPSTFNAARLACGSAIELTQKVLDGSIQNGMAIIRPPGHHAMKSAFCGYCFFNNVGVAAKLALESQLALRILIVDFDVHHGQGTQQMFYNDPRVLYFSTHRYEHGRFWPHLKESNYNWIGGSDGIGFNCNVPLNVTKMGNTEFLTVWHQVLLPMAYQFNPHLVLVSAGFDSALNDPKGEMQITPQCYPHLISPLMGLAEGKVAVILEGGYCLKALAEGAALTLRTLLGDPCPRISPTLNPMPELVSSVLDSFFMLFKYWALGAANRSTQTQSDSTNQVHVPELIYDWIETVPNEYQTRFPSHVERFELALPFNELMDQLIRTTDLTVANTRLGIAFDQQLDPTNFNLEEFSDEWMQVSSPEDGITALILSMADEMIKGRCQSGIVVTPEMKPKDKSSTELGFTRLTDSVIKRFLDNGKFNRIMVLNVDSSASQGKLDSSIFKNEPNILHISLHKCSQPNNSSPKNGFNIEIFDEDVSLSWVEVLFALTNIILPVAYEFSPDLLLITGTGPHNQQCYAQVVHLLKPLANGRLLLLFEYDSNSQVWMHLCIQALLGDPIPSMLSVHRIQISDVALASICNALDACADYWTTLKPFRKLVQSDVEIKVGCYT